ncbi:MAG: antibiotic biosynthesis monooxygenase [Alphaproteobacteria bacterium]
MIAVIFEVEPSSGNRELYLNMAASLREELSKIDGFLSVERFESLTQPGRLLSLSFWRDEAAVVRWRQQDAHRKAQYLGREKVFAHYRLRVAEVTRDYSLTDRDQAPTDSRALHG